jgi:hypothetical protein
MLTEGSARGQQSDRRVGMALGGTVGGGSARSWRRRGGEQGRAAGHDRRDASAADRWGRVATGLGGQCDVPPLNKDGRS